MDYYNTWIQFVMSGPVWFSVIDFVILFDFNSLKIFLQYSYMD